MRLSTHDRFQATVCQGSGMLLLSLFLLGGVAETVAAEGMMPTPTGTGTIVTPHGNRFDIEGGRLSGDGANLFHSFFRFGLSQGQIANFLSNPAIRNILVRVIGGEASRIDGVIQVTGGPSNLFLMNPSGIVFGNNARLNVSGSFTATTANAIGFGSEWFNAVGANHYDRLVGNPTSFAFTMPQPGGIINAGNLTVSGVGQTLMLLAGTVASTGELAAPAGRVVVGSIAGERIVRLTQAGSLLSLEIQPSAFSSNQPATWSLPILSLPQLLTGGNATHATAATVNSDGTVRLTNSGGLVVNGVAVGANPSDSITDRQLKPGDISIRQLVAQDALLSTANNLHFISHYLDITRTLTRQFYHSPIPAPTPTPPSPILPTPTITTPTTYPIPAPPTPAVPAATPPAYPGPPAYPVSAPSPSVNAPPAYPGLAPPAPRPESVDPSLSPVVTPNLPPAINPSGTELEPLEMMVPESSINTSSPASYPISGPSNLTELEANQPVPLKLGNPTDALTLPTVQFRKTMNWIECTQTSDRWIACLSGREFSSVSKFAIEHSTQLKN